MMTSDLQFTVKQSGFQRYAIHQKDDGRPVNYVKSSVSFNTFCKATDCFGRKLFRIPKNGGRKFQVVNYANSDIVATVNYDDKTCVATVWHGKSLNSPWLNIRYIKKDCAFHVEDMISRVTVATLSKKGRGIERLKPWAHMNLKVSAEYDVPLLALILMSLIFKSFVVDRRFEDNISSGKPNSQDVKS